MFPILVPFSYAFLGPLASLAFSTAFAVLLFALSVTVRKRWHEIMVWHAIRDAAMCGLFLGFLFYAIFYTGLQYTTPGNASLIGLTEVFFTYMFFNVWRKDTLSTRQLVGAVCMVGGAAIALSPNIARFNPGDFLILCSMAIAPIGNFFALRARQHISGEMIFFIRGIIAVPCIFMLAWVLGERFTFQNVQASFWYLVVIGVVLLGFQKLLWIEAIHRISVTKAISLNSFAPLITLLLAWAILSQAPTPTQLGSVIPLIFGTYLLTRSSTPLT